MPNCSSTFESNITSVKTGHTRSCGCYQTKTKSKVRASLNYAHGLRNHPLYSVWASMKSRCLNKKNPAYKAYGGKGVMICESWVNSFENFYNDMWCSYPDDGVLKNGKVLYFLDKDILCREKMVYPKVYSKDTCSWVTRKQNNYEQRSVSVLVDGIKMSLNEGSQILGKNKKYLYKVYTGIHSLHSDFVTRVKFLK